MIGGVPAKTLAAGIAVPLVIALVWVAYSLTARPNLAPYDELWIGNVAAEPSKERVTVTFLGNSTLLICDGQTAIMTDGFFSRPSKWRVLLGRIAPDRERISRALARSGVKSLAAVVVVHSHYDHAMDAPEVARQTGAVVVGSESTANVARGWNLPTEQIRVVEPAKPMSFGRFQVTMLFSRHFPHGMAMGDITKPLVPPAHAFKYKEGGSYSVFIEHLAGSMLVQGSAGWLHGILEGRRADVVFLGIGGMGTRDEAYMEDYFRNVVESVGARVVIPIHWDDFTLPLDQPLEPFPWFFDDVERSLRFLVRRARQASISLHLLATWEPIDPFAIQPGTRYSNSPG